MSQARKRAKRNFRLWPSANDNAELRQSRKNFHGFGKKCRIPLQRGALCYGIAQHHNQTITTRKKIISRRVGKKSMGFLTEDSGREQVKTIGISDRRDIDLLRLLQPQDLIKYGFIPEFICR